MTTNLTDVLTTRWAPADCQISKVPVGTVDVMTVHPLEKNFNKFYNSHLYIHNFCFYLRLKINPSLYKANGCYCYKKKQQDLYENEVLQQFNEKIKSKFNKSLQI